MIFLDHSLLWFSLELSPANNQMFRHLILQNHSVEDFLFESNRHLLSPEHLNRLRRRALESQLFSHFEKEYRTLDNLKSSYKPFVQEMKELVDSLRAKSREEHEPISENLCLHNRVREKMLYIALKELAIARKEDQIPRLMDDLYGRNQAPSLQCTYPSPPWFRSFDSIPQQELK